jgi:hypothetical protein
MAQRMITIVKTIKHHNNARSVAKKPTLPAHWGYRKIVNGHPGHPC